MPDVQHQAKKIQREHLNDTGHAEWSRVSEDEYRVTDKDTGDQITVLYGDTEIVNGIGRVKNIKEVRSSE